MVLRRDEADPTVLASFRPTRRQVLGRRLRAGCAVSAGLAVLLSVPAMVGPEPLAAAWLLGIAVPVLVGFAAGLLGGRSTGVAVAGRTVRLTSAEKVYFPERGFTKGDVFRYYLAVGDGIMRALRERPTTLQRFPEGIDGETFFQKRVTTRGAPPWLESARITFPSGRPADELCPVDLAHVVWAAQMGTIVFHPWPVRRSGVDSPDELRIDLDPQPGTDFADAATAAGVIHEVLDELGW